jgi:hypothetical protein
MHLIALSSNSELGEDRMFKSNSQPYENGLRVSYSLAQRDNASAEGALFP